jgi:hypothetical protein
VRHAGGRVGTEPGTVDAIDEVSEDVRRCDEASGDLRSRRDDLLYYGRLVVFTGASSHEGFVLPSVSHCTCEARLS